ncbi:hypothetical protein HW115_03690 [Verrucomicrobiaceae bacterium N1E253]|uniref:VOC domain-containing protein n=1 Tax=Oceaniferula marina TaxID=2748318 RepID=A0A851GBZ4_9BACT|nr:hypothetical protein [Oceaniferula marina]NWK54699.1 hypothetical protein [Oceaniferula marina]
MQEFNHVGIPTTFEREGETYLEDAKLYITDFANHPYKIEWLRFEEDSPMPEILKTTAHVAYMVDDLEKAMEGKQTLLEPFEPMEGLRVAFILDDGAPVEFMQEI